MRRMLLLLLVAVLVLGTLPVPALAEDTLTANIENCAVLGPEGRTITLTIATTKSWEVYCNYANGTFDRETGKGNGTVTFTLNPNKHSDISYYHLIGFVDKATGYTIDAIEFVQMPAPLAAKWNALCKCGADRSLQLYLATYSSGSKRVAVALDPAMDKNAPTHHGVIGNDSAIYCYNCDAELEGLYMLGGIYESSDPYYGYEKHNFSLNQCLKCGYDKGGSTFIPATAISISPSSLTLTVGKDAAVQAVLTPSNSTDQVSWQVQDTAIAFINDRGRVEGKKEGITQLLATTSSGKTASCQVVVAPAGQVSQIVLDDATIALGTTAPIGYKVYPDGVDAQLKWTSSDEKVVRVDADTGKCVPVEPGTATITATAANGVKGSCQVTVTGPAPKSIAITNASALKSIVVGEKNRRQIEISGTPSLAPAQWKPNYILWRSTKPAIADVSANGVITGIIPGKATIEGYTLSAGGKAKVWCKLNTTVEAIPVTDILISGGDRVKLGKKLQLTAAVKPAKATDSSIVWSSSDSSVASVDPITGQVTGLKKGAAKITATNIPSKVTSTVTVRVVSFTPRLVEPERDNPYYYKQAGDKNPANVYLNILPLPNCTTYAYGRACEILEGRPDLNVRNNASTWYAINKEKYDSGKGGYPYGPVPKVGAILCEGGGAGHVAVVEKIVGNDIVISQSGYSWPIPFMVWPVEHYDKQNGKLTCPEKLKVSNANGARPLTMARIQALAALNGQYVQGFIYLIDDAD